MDPEDGGLTELDLSHRGDGADLGRAGHMGKDVQPSVPVTEGSLRESSWERRNEANPRLQRSKETLRLGLDPPLEAYPGENSHTLLGRQGSGTAVTTTSVKVLHR